MIIFWVPDLALRIVLVDWSPVTREEALDGTRDPFYIYAVEKTLAERALWDFADKHPHIDVTTG